MTRKTLLNIIIVLGASVFILIKSGIFAPKDELVMLQNNYALCKKPDDKHFAIHRLLSVNEDGGWNRSLEVDPIIVSEPIYDGTIETITCPDIKDSKEWVVLTAAGEKYLFDCSHGKLLLDGNSFTQYSQDNTGGSYFNTIVGIYPLSETPGLPTKVEKYYRTGTGNDTFIYRQKGRWGVYNRVVKEHGAYTTPEYIYIQILPAQFDKIRLIRGDGAFHYVAYKNGEWQLFDARGRKREMCTSTTENQHQMNVKTSTGHGEGIITDTYISNIINIPTNSNNQYNSYLRTQCTYSGDEEAGIIILNNQPNKYKRFFAAWNGDWSIFDFDWDNKRYDFDYNYPSELSL